MKRIFTVLFAAIIACALYSCSKGQSAPAETVDFGIHRVIKSGELPAGLSATLENLNIRLETDSLSPFYGYIDNNQLNILKTDISGSGMKLAKTLNTMDDERLLYGVVIIAKDPEVTGEDIYKAIPQGDNVELRFKRTGAEKWAEMTAECTGGFVAFMVDGEAYSIPAVMAEIRSGVAIIYGIGSEDEALRISDALN